MHSLSELKEFLLKEGIEVKEFGGWYLKVHKDTWTLLNDKFYKNNEPQNIKQKGLFDKYKRVINERNKSGQTRKWRGISSRNYK